MMDNEKDVKETQDSSTETAANDSVDTAKAEESEVFVEESKRTIPYARFKEKAAEAKELKRMIDKLSAEKEMAVQETAKQYQTYYESELAKVQRSKAEEDINIYDEPSVDTKINPLLKEIETLKREINGIKSKSETSELKTQINNLKGVYPEMDEEHVYVVKKTKPDWSLEDCAEYSHKHFETLLKEKFSKMMEKKKEAAKKPVFNSEGKLNIAPGKKPKTMKEAHAAMMAYARELDGGN